MEVIALSIAHILIIENGMMKKILNFSPSLRFADREGGNIWENCYGSDVIIIQPSEGIVHIIRLSIDCRCS